MVTNLPKVDEIKSPNICQGKFLTPFQRQLLQKNLEQDLPELSRQRIQIMLLADEGKTQTQIRKELGCCPATARHWIHIARSGMAHQWNSSPIGRPKIVNEQYLERLQQLINHSPREFGYSFEKCFIKNQQLEQRVAELEKSLEEANQSRWHNTFSKQAANLVNSELEKTIAPLMSEVERLNAVVAFQEQELAQLQNVNDM
ncbi:helix-turn-helix domain-containing protein [Sphaerospermopsis kisseleviana CS-549]|uniref:Uncharacterized protein n=2 Tax=Sphaerospermopsis TaxID=752201 RepID=A0A480A833_9CYAN|nr:MULTISPECIES: helix-turn-helix domain-containing protein [Sphaerospermopsis]MBD2131089.1 helix-turn-helix domain-containing protein [Sphaerospermopsis sp. FACHB-1094]MDB9441510.1 helix-turn-helix domain-containing protein [Sphaerospermopsis kisseleviana CS-549]BAZ83718.1 hypothetical protein NIES73_50070 [Sphaerospermopsis kisseleviana NIES-73]GCL38354.1 hypothetical protein SR1949_34680 [Sphaerospermopsis reniformis]